MATPVYIEALIDFNIKAFNEHHDEKGRFSEGGEGKYEGKEGSSAHGRQPSKGEMDRAHSAIENAKKDDIHFTLLHEPPAGKVEMRLAEKANAEGKTGVIIKSEPRVFVEEHAKDTTTYFHDDNHYAHVSPDRNRQGRFSVETYVADHEGDVYQQGNTSYATRERATKAAIWHAQHSYDGAHADFKTEYKLTTDVGHTVNRTLEQHREESAMPDVFTKTIKVLK